MVVGVDLACTLEQGVAKGSAVQCLDVDCSWMWIAVSPGSQVQLDVDCMFQLGHFMLHPWLSLASDLVLVAWHHGGED